MQDLYFILSKVIGFFLDPLHIIAGLVCVLAF